MPPRPAALEPKQQRSHETRRRLLDAAVDELLEHGYVSLTTPAVARRAGVSRGAQQNHFPHRATMVAEAVRHLAQRQTAELEEAIERVPRGKARVSAALDILFEAYSGKLFAALVELSLAARHDAELREVVTAEERAISHTFGELAEASLGPRWSTALSAVRGLALLKLLGHPAASVDRQWAATQRDLLALLTS